MMIKDYRLMIELHHPYGVIKKNKFKMINFDDYTNENKTEHNSNWPYIPDHPYRIAIVGSF